MICHHIPQLVSGAFLFTWFPFITQYADGEKSCQKLFQWRSKFRCCILWDAQGKGFILLTLSCSSKQLMKARIIRFCFLLNKSVFVFTVIFRLSFSPPSSSTVWVVSVVKGPIYGNSPIVSYMLYLSGLPCVGSSLVLYDGNGGKKGLVTLHWYTKKKKGKDKCNSC